MSYIDFNYLSSSGLPDILLLVFTSKINNTSLINVN
jgi:hypothetical protein